ncbi:MAG TPA: PCRF domain-containing protein, partial [Miltoncostaeaceae bacterium]|nr:PCRF domain-containing protein [Miltoncostaeaceae bacterium]
QHLVERGFSPQHGARPLQREIQHALVAPLAELLVAAPVDGGGLLTVRIADGRIALALAPLDEAGEEADAAAVEAPAGRLEDVAARLGDVCEEIAVAADGARVARLRDEVDRLLAETRAPSFWDDPDAARATLGRVYRVEGVLGRLDRLVRRAEGAGEWARMVVLRRDRRARGELADAARELATELAYLRVALAAAAEGEEAGGARVVVTALGPDAAEWAAEIATMYAAWAGARRMDVNMEPPAGGRTELRLEGESCLELLLGEAGLHRLTGSGTRAVARVAVGALDGGEPGSRDEIVRTYAQGRHRGVRDPRTGVRVGDVTAVLAGSIDPFLVAWADLLQTPLVE